MAGRETLTVRRGAVACRLLRRVAEGTGGWGGCGRSPPRDREV